MYIVFVWYCVWSSFYMGFQKYARWYMYCKSANIGQIWAQCPKIDLQNLECSGYTLSIVYKINFVIICLTLIDRVKKLQQNPLKKIWWEVIYVIFLKLQTMHTLYQMVKDRYVCLPQFYLVVIWM